MKHKLYIISAGPGAPEFLSIQAKELLGTLSHVLCFERLKPLIKDEKRQVVLGKLSDAPALCEHYLKNSDLGLLVSGSASFHSIAPYIKRSLADGLEVEIVPGLSSLDYLLAKIGVQREDCVFESCHGQEFSFDALYQYAKEKSYLGLLCDKLMSPQNIAKKLIELGHESSRMYVGEKLSYADEVIVYKSSRDIAAMRFDDLSVCLIELEGFRQDMTNFGMDASVFKKHPKVPVTKAEVRSVILSKLKLFDSSTLWDVGAGSGSVAIEACLLNPHLKAYCFEKNDYAIDALKENISAFKLDKRVRAVKGLAPSSFLGHDLPDTVFVGGSSGEIETIINYLISQATKDIRLVVSAISLENAYLSHKIMSQALFKDLHFEQVSISRLEALASTEVLRAENPVFIISATIAVAKKR